jgi:Zn-dependent peptidase ImmA (M78 family)
MTVARTRMAAGAARRLLTKLQIASPPVDVEGVARRLGIKVQEEEFPDTLSGALVRSDEGKAFIAVNKAHHRHRRRFSIAHELAHFVLHQDAAGYYDQKHKIGVHFRAAKGGNWDAKEVEANRFAAELLMPRRMIIDAIVRSGEAEASALARQFDVSEEAMTYRLADIRLR